MGFNQMAVNSFFSLLEEIEDTNKLHVENIWNCDKPGISSVLKCLSKIVSTKGKRQVGSLTSRYLVFSKWEVHADHEIITE